MIRQLVDTLPAGPINVDDHRFTFPDKHLVYTEIESLINHFKLVMFPLALANLVVTAIVVWAVRT